MSRSSPSSRLRGHPRRGWPGAALADQWHKLVQTLPLIAEAKAHIQGSAILLLPDAEVIWLDSDGMAQFDALHRRVNDGKASVCAFDLLMLNAEDLRRKPYVERKAALRKLLRQGRGIQYVEHAECHGVRLFEAVCKLGLEGIVSKKLDTPYRSGPLKASIIGKKFNGPGSNAGPGGSFLMSVSIVPTVNNHTVIRFLTILVDMAASGLGLATKKPTSQYPLDD